MKNGYSNCVRQFSPIMVVSVTSRSRAFGTSVIKEMLFGSISSMTFSSIVLMSSSTLALSFESSKSYFLLKQGSQK